MQFSMLLSGLSKYCRCLVGDRIRLLSPQMTESVSGRTFEFPLDINLITDDSREVRPGALFVAVPGGLHDGHVFIAHAIQKGAVAVVGEWPIERVAGEVSVCDGLGFVRPGPLKPPGVGVASCCVAWVSFKADEARWSHRD